MKSGIFIIGGLALLGAYGLYRIARTGMNLVTESSVRLSSLHLTKVVLALEPVVKNPTGGTITIAFPFVKIFFNGSLIASTTPQNLKVKIRPRSEVNLRTLLREKTGKDFTLTLPLSSGLALIPKLVQLATGAIQSIPVKTEISTTIHAGAGIPYRQVDEIQITKPKFL